MKQLTCTVLILGAITLQAVAQQGEQPFVVVSYHVENLFDIADEPAFDDDAFTPEGEMEWTAARYNRKITDLNRVILSIPEKELPAIIGLAEVENRGVLEDLASHRGLRRGKYRIIHEDGRDPKGLECACLYRPELFTYLSHRYIPVEDPADPQFPYRDILHLSGEGPDGTRLHVFMNHWKSRQGEKRINRRQRMFSAITLRRQLDMLFSGGSGFKVIIMGNFNDEPTNRSITNGLSASNKRKNIGFGEYYNLFYDTHNLEETGTYADGGEWKMLDQIIVSYNFIYGGSGLSTGFDGGRILREDWMLREGEPGGTKVPYPTYDGTTYLGGPSDHLPVYVIFTY